MVFLCLAKFTLEIKKYYIYGPLQSGYLSFFYRRGKEWKHIRSSASKQIVPRQVANYAQGLSEIGDGFVEYIRRKRRPDGLLEDVSSALVKWAFQGFQFQNAAIQLTALRPLCIKFFPLQHTDTLPKHSLASTIMVCFSICALSVYCPVPSLLQCHLFVYDLVMY